MCNKGHDKALIKPRVNTIYNTLWYMTVLDMSCFLSQHFMQIYTVL